MKETLPKTTPTNLAATLVSPSPPPVLASVNAESPNDNANRAFFACTLHRGVVRGESGSADTRGTYRGKRRTCGTWKTANKSEEKYERFVTEEELNEWI